MSFRNSVRRLHTRILPTHSVCDEEDPNFNEDTLDDDDSEVGIDPSLIAPDGRSLRVRRATLQNPPDLNVHRTALTVARKHEEFQYETPYKPGFRETLARSCKKKATCSKKRARDILYLRLPILDWLFHYKFGRNLFNDVIAGTTVAVMNIPQGMAYAMLANLDPIVGIYMAFFPVLVYATFATSRHCSMGTFAVICIMTGKVVSELATEPTAGANFIAMDAANATGVYTRNEVAAILSFACGVWMFIFGIFQLGSLCVFLSDMLVSGFTTGASIHVLTSQVPKLFGMNSTSYQGIFKIPKTWFSIFGNMLDSNSATMVISLVCLFVLVLNNEVFKPRLRKVTIIPFPIELVVVVAGTVASYFGQLNENFDVEIVGEIPTGLPAPTKPSFELFGDVLISSLTISIVSYSVSFSMAKIFAKKLDYPVDATQELYALGAADIVGSLFSCAPISASLSRSLIQQSVGGATQLASYISCGLLVFVLLFIGPYFESLPNCVLASIIAVALKGMFLQVSDFFKMWKVSRVDAMVWLITFLGVVILDIDYGLFLGILAALMLLIYRNQAPKMMLLGKVYNTEIYLDITRYSAAVQIPGIKICQVLGNLHFANQESFRLTLTKTTGLNPKAILKWKRKQEKLQKKKLKAKGKSMLSFANNITIEIDAKLNTDIANVDSENEKNLSDFQFQENNHDSKSPKIDDQDLPVPKEVVSLIVDFSCVSQVDISAAKNLASIHKDFQEADVVVLFAALSEPALEVMSKAGAFTDLSDDIFFHSVSDAVAFLMSPDVDTPPEAIAHF